MEEVKDSQKQVMDGPISVERTKNAKVYVPRTDIYETSEGITLIADMPGVDATSVDVVIEKNTLTITGTVDPSSYKHRGIIFSEYDVGDYQRAFTITDEIDREHVVATVKDGVLRLKLPKTARLKAKKIEIQAA